MEGTNKTLFTNDMLIYVDNLKELANKTKTKKSTKRPCLELLKDYNKVAGYIIKIQKLMFFLHISNGQWNLKLKTYFIFIVLYHPLKPKLV